MVYKSDVNLNTQPTQFEEAEIAIEIKPFRKRCDPFQDPPVEEDEEEDEGDEGDEEDEGPESEDEDTDEGRQEDEEGDKDQNNSEGEEKPGENSYEINEDQEEDGGVPDIEQRKTSTLPIFEAPEIFRMQCRGQIANYANTILARQHRTHCFVIWMGDPWARFIRIDRDGGIVSARFNYRKRSDLLLEFFWRYSTASESSKGKDPSVRRANPTESALAQDMLARWKPREDKFHTAYEMTTQDAPDDEDMPPAPLVPRRKIRQVLVWAPFAEPESVRGRATRVYPGYDPVSKEIVLVKDVWRPLAPDNPKETETLRILNDASVRSIPILLCGDDIQGEWQRTVTHSYTNEPWNICRVKKSFQQRQHTQFATDKLGSPLGSFSRSKTMVVAICDALIG